MFKLTKVLVVSLIALGTFAVASDDGTELRARLTGVGSGRAQWESEGVGTAMRSELEVQGRHLAAHASFTVTIGTNAPFSVTTNARGSFESEQRFTGTGQPVVNAGDSVTVADASVTIVLSGVMQSH
ncbi:MAG: hypothetical protein ACHQ50_03170 [Fimbriimonadales bacterium]